MIVRKKIYIHTYLGRTVTCVLDTSGASDKSYKRYGCGTCSSVGSGTVLTTVWIASTPILLFRTRNRVNYFRSSGTRYGMPTTTSGSFKYCQILNWLDKFNLAGWGWRSGCDELSILENRDRLCSPILPSVSRLTDRKP